MSSPDSAIVSSVTPLRANLSLCENITIGLQYTKKISSDHAFELIECVLRKLDLDPSIYNKRDDELTYTQRFIGKFLRIAVTGKRKIIIERPSLLLPDVHYPNYLNDFFLKISRKPSCSVLNATAEYSVIDYEWNRCIWPKRTQPNEY